jgi:hypothetical protein
MTMMTHDNNTKNVMEKLAEAGFAFEEGELNAEAYVSIMPGSNGSFELCLWIGKKGYRGFVDIADTRISADSIEVIPPKRRQTTA